MPVAISWYLTYYFTYRKSIVPLPFPPAPSVQKKYIPPGYQWVLKRYGSRGDRGEAHTTWLPVSPQEVWIKRRQRRLLLNVLLFFLFVGLVRSLKLVLSTMYFHSLDGVSGKYMDAATSVSFYIFPFSRWRRWGVYWYSHRCVTLYFSIL